MTDLAQTTAHALRILADEIQCPDDVPACCLRFSAILIEQQAEELDAQAEELAALRRNRASWEASGLALETRVRELEHAIGSAIACIYASGGGITGTVWGRTSETLVNLLTAALGPQPQATDSPLPASRGTTSGQLLQLHDRAERPDAYAGADSEGGEA